jgi:hypothetical protein
MIELPAPTLAVSGPHPVPGSPELLDCLFFFAFSNATQQLPGPVRGGSDPRNDVNGKVLVEFWKIKVPQIYLSLDVWVGSQCTKVCR